MKNKEKVYKDSVEYITLLEVVKLLGRNTIFNKDREIKQISKIPNVRKTIDQNQLFYSVLDINFFLNTHIPRDEIIRLFNLSKRVIDRHIRKNNTKSYRIGNKDSLMYYPKNNIYQIFSEYINKIDTEVKYIEDVKYINIYKIAILFDRDPEKLRDYKSRSRFAKYLLNIPNLKIIKQNDNDLYNLSDVKNFLENYISRIDAMELLNVSLLTFDKYINEHSIKVIQFGNSMQYKYYLGEDIKKLSEGSSYDKELHMTIYDIARKYFQRVMPNFIIELRNNIRKHLNESITEIKLTGKIHNVKSGRYIYSVYLMSEVIQFFDNHFSKIKVLELLSQIANKNKVQMVMEKYSDITIIPLGKNLNSIFYTKADFKKLYEAAKNENELIESGKKDSLKVGEKVYYSKKRSMEILKLGIKVFNKIEGKELPIFYKLENVKFFDAKDIDMFLEKLKLDLDEINNNYYTIEQIKEKYSKQYIAVLKNKNNMEIEYKKLSVFLKNWLQSNGGHVYKKNDVDSNWDLYFKKVTLSKISMENPFDEFVYKVEQVLNLKFPHNLAITKKLWYENVEKSLIKSNRSNIRGLIHLFVNTTESILDIFKKEIFYYTTKEINNRFLNQNNSVSRTQQRQIYRFIRLVVETFNLQNKSISIIIEHLNNPTKFNSINEQDTSIYTLAEYHEFYDYCNWVDNHKIKALSDVKNYISDVKKGVLRTNYKKYDSSWLYVMVQLTNNWRHSTIITQIPRIDLSNTRISSLEWLEKNDPSIEEANDIVFQIGRYVQHIHKTTVNSEGVFNIGEPLKIAFATAIAICELRAQFTDDNSEILIKLTLGKNYLLTRLVANRNPYDIFFCDFRNDLVFENRKMNRTLSTLIWSVLRHIGKGLKESQLSRGHKNQETTIEHYIILGQKQVNQLVMELFERNNFGHITQLFSNIIFGEEVDKLIETENIKSTTELFGNSIKIEATSGLINKLAQERETVLKYLTNLNSDEVWGIYLNSIAGNLPTKERYYQCVFSECKFEDEYGQKPHCRSCGAAIINVYALSQLMDSYVNLLHKVANEFDGLPLGEKKKLSNHFHLLYQIVNEARGKFGRNVLDGFVDGGNERIKSLGEIVSSKDIMKFLTVN